MFWGTTKDPQGEAAKNRMQNRRGEARGMPFLAAYAPLTGPGRCASGCYLGRCLRSRKNDHTVAQKRERWTNKRHLAGLTGETFATESLGVRGRSVLAEGRNVWGREG